MRRLAAILLAVLLLAGNLQLPAASEPAVPTVSTVPAPAAGGDTPPAAPWWERTSRDADRNGIVDWLETRDASTAGGVSYG